MFKAIKGMTPDVIADRYATLESEAISRVLSKFRKNIYSTATKEQKKLLDSQLFVKTDS